MKSNKILSVIIALFLLITSFGSVYYYNKNKKKYSRNPSIEELVEMVYNCTIQDSKTVCAIMAYYNKIK